MLARFALALLVPVMCAAQCAPGYSMTAQWSLSSLPGHTPARQSYWTNQVGAQAEWRPGFQGPVRARVWFYKIVFTSGNDSRTELEITHAGGAATLLVDAGSGESGWVDLGVYSFTGTCDDRVTLTKRTPGVNTRIAAVRFDSLSEASGQAIASFVLDEPTGNALGDVAVAWVDLAGSPHRAAIETQSFRGYLEGISAREFGPEAPILQGDYALWLVRAVRWAPVETGGQRRLPSSPELRAAAAEAARDAGIVDVPDPERPLGTDELIAMTARAAAIPGKNLEWLASTPEEWLRAGWQAAGRPTRLDAALLFRRFADGFVSAGPPAGRAWRMTFRDEFDDEALDRRVWNVESGSPGHIVSSRWPENIAVSNGFLKLLTRKEARGGKDWTSGHIWTRYRQQYGYFEARMKIARASGLNNAFWLITSGQGAAPQFEIDITESHFPRRHTFTLHNNNILPRAPVGKQHISASDLSEEFHVFAVDWTERNLTFYLDGMEVGQTPCNFCNSVTDIRFSTAVAAWTGAITDALDGTRMEVDWVRVYAPAP